MAKSDISSPVHESTSSQYDQVFSLMKIPHVVMNIDYKLEPITDKKRRLIFSLLDIILMPNYCITSKLAISI